MYYSYVEIEYVATSFSPARMDLAVKLLICVNSHWDTLKKRMRLHVSNHMFNFFIIQVSWKNVLTNIDYMIGYGQLTNNPQAAKIFEYIYKFV
jgi:hypothetical protein